MFLALRGCLETSKSPVDLQLGNITPVFKKCKRSHKKNHLLLSILKTCESMYEQTYLHTLEIIFSGQTDYGTQYVILF